MKQKLGTILAAAIVVSSLALGTPSMLHALRGLSSAGREPEFFHDYNKRYTPAKSALPAGQAIGYFTDEQEGVPATMRYLYARILIAPRVLAFDRSREYVLADLLPEMKAQLPKGYETVKDFGGGLLLLRKTK